MKKDNRVNGKESLTNILNFMLSNGDQTKEVINIEETDFLLNGLKTQVVDSAGNFTPKHYELFESRFGLVDNGCFKTYEEVAGDFNTTIVRVRQAEAMGLRSLIYLYDKEKQNQQQDSQKHRR